MLELPKLQYSIAGFRYLVKLNIGYLGNHQRYLGMSGMFWIALKLSSSNMLLIARLSLSFKKLTAFKNDGSEIWRQCSGTGNIRDAVMAEVEAASLPSLCIH